tara:strand:+ start:524 stop:937 length:414 start_codon:yes stop_codon:yes gene_type:complete
MNDNDQEINNMLEDVDINEMMIEESENINTRLKSIFKFFNKRIRHYNMQIQILTRKTINLKKEMYSYYDIIQEYKRDVDRQARMDTMECKICRDEISNCIIEPCKHMVCCYDCFQKIEDGKCPMCRVEYTNCYRIYY